MNKHSADAAKRVRRHHSRSKAGCLPCRKAHNRCDGSQPTCESCVRMGKTCHYPPPDPPLRERRALCQPGQLSPWLLSANRAQPITLLHTALDHNPIDPFDSLAVSMPFRSKQLLHYFLRTRDESSMPLDAKTYHLLPALVQNPVSLRNTLLIASLHYVWAAGDVQTYNATVLFHRAETIQSLNEQLRNPQTMNVLTLVKHISTLCFTDLALGNMVDAGAHLDGLVTILDHFYPTDAIPKSQMGLEEELTNRYLLLESHLVLSLKTWMRQSQLLSQVAGHATVSELAEYATLLFDWHSQDIGDLQRQLDTISMYPFFFATPPRTARFKHVDATPVLECLRPLTVSAMTVTAPTHGQSKNKDPTWAWIHLVISKLHFALGESHVASLYGSTRSGARKQQDLQSSWFSIAAAAGFYLHSVLGLWNSGNPINPRLYRYLLVTLLRDLAKPENYLQRVPSTDLWFWKHFIYALSLTWHQQRIYNERLQGMERYFRHSLRSWSQMSGVIHWEEAQERLRKFAWPTGPEQPLARNVWENAMSPNHEEG